jgi:hypothetical protein
VIAVVMGLGYTPVVAFVAQQIVHLARIVGGGT